MCACVCAIHIQYRPKITNKKRGVCIMRPSGTCASVCSSLWAQQPATELCNICNSSQVRAHLFAIKKLLRRVSGLRPRCCARPIKMLLRRVCSLRPRPSATIAVRHPACNTPATSVRHSIRRATPQRRCTREGGRQARAPLNLLFSAAGTLFRSV